jgi:BirA family biotin operon repressor/biotin-[acetyl-CoA-carboxylase] ligase
MELVRFHYGTITSTNDFAKELLLQHNFVLVTADYQTQGRGRNKNKWEGSHGLNLYASFGIKYQNLRRVEEVSYLQGLGALATIYSLREIAPNFRFVLKYPNDVYAKCPDGLFRKISGILIEHQFLGEFCTSSVIGIGININQTTFPDEIKEKATSLKLLGKEEKPDILCEHLIAQVQKLFELYPHEIMNLWEIELNLSGKQIRVITTNQVFTAEGIDFLGRLFGKTLDNEEVFVTDGDSVVYELE